MKTTLQLKIFIWVAALSMIGVNSQNNENDTTELTNWTQQYIVKEGGHLKWQHMESEQALDDNDQVKLFLNAKSDILYLEFSEAMGMGVLKQICVYGMEEQQLLCVKTTDSQFALDIPSLKYKGAVTIEVRTKKNTYNLKAVFN